MPTINVLTWNSRGESPAKATFLQSLILNNPSVPGWQPDLIFIQEALASPGGAVWNMLSNLGAQPGGANYTAHAAQFAALASEGYIFKVSNNITVSGTFGTIDLARDAGVIASINAFSIPERRVATAEVRAMRNPAYTSVTIAGRLVSFLTWHAPLGPSAVIHGISAAVNYDAYYFLQNSTYYTGTLRQPGVGNLALVAGDLNVTDNDLSNPTHAPAIPRLFPSWVGVSSKLDHILAYRNVGPATSITFPNAGAYSTGGVSDHAVQVSTVKWP